MNNEEHAKKFHAAGGKKVFQLLGKRHLEKLKNDLEYRKKYSEKMSKTQSGEKNGFYGRKHSEETKEKMRLAKRRKNGEKIQKTDSFRISQQCSNDKNYIECQAHNLKVVGENPALATMTS